MKLTPETWLEKMEKEGRADDVFIIIHGKEFTPREIVKNKLLWIQVVKSV